MVDDLREARERLKLARETLYTEATYATPLYTILADLASALAAVIRHLEAPEGNADG